MTRDRELSAAGWVKSSRSNPNGDCVEVNLTDPSAVRVRDSKQRDIGPVLTLSRAQWGALLDVIRANA